MLLQHRFNDLKGYQLLKTDAHYTGFYDDRRQKLSCTVETKTVKSLVAVSTFSLSEQTLVIFRVKNILEVLCIHSRDDCDLDDHRGKNRQVEMRSNIN